MSINTRQSPILDIHGQPISVADLDEPQSENPALTALLHRHHSSHPSSGLTLGKIASLLRDAEDGDLIGQSEVAEDMEEKDAHIQSELCKRKLACQSVPWRIEPPRQASAAEKRDAQMLEELLEDATWLHDATFDLQDATLKGFANLELQWSFAEGAHYVTGAEWRDPAWFQTHPSNRNELRLRNGSYEGEALRPFGWLSHTAKAKSGYVSRRGLIRVLLWPYIFKNYSVRDLAEFLEIYGLPIRLGKYPAGASNTEKATLLRAVMSIGHNAGGIIPKGMEIDFQHAADGASDPFMAMVSWCEKSQSKAILGGTLTSQADGKSSTNALGNVHNEVRQEIRDADLNALANTLTRDLIYPLYALNGKSYRSPRRIPRLVFDLQEPEDLKTLAEGLKPLVEMNMPVPIRWVQEKARIPEPVNGEAILSLNPSALTEPLPGQASLKQRETQPAVDPEEQRLLDEQAALEAAIKALNNDELNAQSDAILAPLLELAAEGPETMADKLESLVPDEDLEPLINKIAKVLFVAGLVGGSEHASDTQTAEA